MLQIIKGDLFSDDHEAIAHGCNCFNTMGKGIAVDIKKKYPEVYEKDQETKKGDRKKLGKFTFYDYFFENISDNDLIVFNLYSQYTYTNINDMFYIDAYKSSLKSACEHTKNTGRNSISIPAIGLGLANGNISEIYEVNKELSKIIDINWYFFENKLYNKISEIT